MPSEALSRPAKEPLAVSRNARSRYLPRSKKSRAACKGTNHGVSGLRFPAFRNREKIGGVKARTDAVARGSKRELSRSPSAFTRIRSMRFRSSYGGSKRYATSAPRSGGWKR